MAAGKWAAEGKVEGSLVAAHGVEAKEGEGMGAGGPVEAAVKVAAEAEAPTVGHLVAAVVAACRGRTR